MNDKASIIIYSFAMPIVNEFSTIQIIAVMALPLVMAIVLHEVAHGYVAYLKGDSTARQMGRLTINPLAHIDPFGTVLVPIVFFYATGILFAFAKPVPVNYNNLRRPREDMVLVAAAGPMTNVILAIASAVVLHVLGFFSPEIYSYAAFISEQMIPDGASPLLFPVVGMLYFSIVLNVVLAIINLIPVPPADGGRIVSGLLPPRQAELYSKIEPFGLMILVVIIVMNPLGITDKVIWPLITSLVNLLM